MIMTREWRVRLWALRHTVSLHHHSSNHPSLSSRRRCRLHRILGWEHLHHLWHMLRCLRPPRIQYLTHQMTCIVCGGQIPPDRMRQVCRPMSRSQHQLSAGHQAQVGRIPPTHSYDHTVHPNSATPGVGQSTHGWIITTQTSTICSVWHGSLCERSCNAFMDGDCRLA